MLPCSPCPLSARYSALHSALYTQPTAFYPALAISVSLTLSTHLRLGRALFRVFMSRAENSHGSPGRATPPGSNQAMHRMGERLVERGGFEPPKAIASRFTVCPVWPLRYLSAISPTSKQKREIPIPPHGASRNFSGSTRAGASFLSNHYLGGRNARRPPSWFRTALNDLIPTTTTVPSWSWRGDSNP